jgi:hypothetical protein
VANLPLDNCPRALHPIIGGTCPSDQFSGVSDRCEGISELMGQSSQELVFLPVCPAQRRLSFSAVGVSHERIATRILSLRTRVQRLCK